MRASAPEIVREDGRLRVEARNAAAALAAVTEELGTSARIVAVDRVVRGGIAGFFTREFVQVTADSGAAPGDAPPDDRAAAAPAEPDRPEIAGAGPPSFADVLRDAGRDGPRPAVGGDDRDRTRVWSATPAVVRRRPPQMVGSPVAIALDRLLKADSGEDFGVALRRELARTGWQPQHGSPATSRTKRVWVDHGDGDDTGGTAALSVDAARALDLPPQVVDAVEGLPGDAHSAWVAAVAGAIAPFCTPLPAGDRIFVGPAAGALVADWDVPVASVDGEQHVGGDIAVCADDSGAGRGAVEVLRDGRWVHLVVGRGSWRWHLLSGPLAVSWTDVADLPAALQVAAEHGLVLGSPSADPRSREAADPDAVARALVGLVAHHARGR